MSRPFGLVNCLGLAWRAHAKLSRRARTHEELGGGLCCCSLSIVLRVYVEERSQSGLASSGLAVLQVDRLRFLCQLCFKQAAFASSKQDSLYCFLPWSDFTHISPWGGVDALRGGGGGDSSKRSTGYRRGGDERSILCRQWLCGRVMIYCGTTPFWTEFIKNNHVLVTLRIPKWCSVLAFPSRFVYKYARGVCCPHRGAFFVECWSVTVAVTCSCGKFCFCCSGDRDVFRSFGRAMAREKSDLAAQAKVEWNPPRLTLIFHVQARPTRSFWSQGVRFSSPVHMLRGSGGGVP